jgi:hypothetical protein
MLTGAVAKKEDGEAVEREVLSPRVLIDWDST